MIDMQVIKNEETIFWRLKYFPYRHRANVKELGDFKSKNLLTRFIKRELIRMGRIRPINCNNIEIVICDSQRHARRIRYKIKNRGMFEAHKMKKEEIIKVYDFWNSDYWGYRFR